MNSDLLIFIFVTIASTISAVVGGLFTYLGVKKKSMSSGFSSILEANERFREEVREDLKKTKQESESLKIKLNNIEIKYKSSVEQISDLQKIIIEYQREISELKTIIKQYQSEISILKLVIDDYKLEAEKLREQLGRIVEKS